MKLIIFILVIVLSFSASEEKLLKLKPDKIITDSEMADSIFFSEINCINFTNNNYYLHDSRNSRVVVLDKNFKHLFNFGRRGNGPGEFQEIGYGVIKNNLYFIKSYMANF